METLVEKLGINLPLLLAQAFNFLLLLAILRATVYKPLLAMMKKRRHEIEQGLEKAEEAQRRLESVDEIRKEAMKEAAAKGADIVRQASDTAHEKTAQILKDAAEKEADIIKRAHEKAENDRTALEERLGREAADLVRAILQERVHLSPEAVDTALIEKAASHIRASRGAATK